MIRTSALNLASLSLKLAASLVLVASTGTLASAAAPQSLESNASTVNVNVYDYAQINNKSLLAAENETSQILATAGVSVRWVDCPTSHAVIKDFPACKSAPDGDRYTLVLLPDSMADAINKDQKALTTEDAVSGSHRASIFYGRISDRVTGNTAATSVLTGRLMAREIGVLLLGKNAASRSGLLKSQWTTDDLSMDANVQMVFTARQARLIQTELIAEARARQPQTQVATSSAR